MKVIRLGVFETNSSSTHSFTSCYTDYEIQPNIEPDWEGEFGWQFDFWNYTSEKLAYICRCLMGYCNGTQEEINKALKPLQERLDGLGVHFEIPTAEELEKSWGYVDHSEDYKSDIEEIIETDEGLLSFLFNDNNGIQGGNDNC